MLFLRTRVVGSDTVNGQNPAPFKKPWNDAPPANTNKLLFPAVSTWCSISSVDSRFPLTPTKKNGLVSQRNT